MDGGPGDAGFGPEAHSNRASRALQRLVEVDPAFGSLALWCVHRDAPLQRALVLERAEGGWSARPVLREVAPAYTDGATVFYGQAFENWSLDEQVGVCAHELLHVALRHVPRARALSERMGPHFEPRLHNVASDAIINETLRAAGHALPTGGVLLTGVLRDVLADPTPVPEALRAWDTETLYAKLAALREAAAAQAERGKPSRLAGGALSQDGDGGKPGSVDGRVACNGSDWDEGLARRAAVLEALLGDAPDLTAGDGAAQGDDAQADLEWQGRLDRALAMGEMAGRGLGAMGYRIGDIPRSRTPWEVLLRRAVSRAVMGEPKPDWSRPARRFLARMNDAERRGLEAPPYEPRIAARPDAKRVAVGVDVSGSISDDLLHRFAGEIAGIGRRTGAEIHLLVFDDGVRSECELPANDLARALKETDFARGGGTSFVEVVDRAAALDPSILVILTDLYGPFGPAPRPPVIWCVPEENAARPAPFGRIILIEA